MKKKTWSIASISSLLVIIAIVIVVNLIGLQLFARADLTENSIYTLSKASRNAVANLEDRLTVKAYFTKDLPPPYNANSRYVKDALEDYRSYGRGNFYFEFVDPADEAKLEQEAQRYRIQPVQVNVMEKDNVQLKKAYMGLVLIYGDKQETLPLVQTVDNFEYEMTSAIKRLAADRLPKVGFLGGFGMPDLGQDMRNVTTALAKHYTVEPINTLMGNSLISTDVNVLCIIQPEEPLDEWTKFCVDQYIMQGGRVAWLINRVKADPNTQQATAINPNIDDLTRKYGFAVSNNLVTDMQASMIQVQHQQGYFTIMNMVRYVAFPELRDFNTAHPIVKDFQTLSLFYPSAVDTSPAAAAGVTITPLFYTSEHTQIQAGRYDINPMAQTKREDFQGGRKVLGAALQGSFKSAFEGKQVPHPTDSTATIPAASIVTQSPETRMIVIGDGNFVQGQYAQGGPAQVLFLNLVDWLGQDDDMIAIRSREAAIRPLKADVSDGTKQTVKYANMFGPPALVLLLGMFRWSLRRNRRRAAA